MDLWLKDKYIVVSGGAKGIGAGIAQTLAEEGAFPIIVGRNEADNLALLQTLGTGAAYTAELSDPKACAAVVHDILAEYPVLHGLVNNAGVNDGVGLQSGGYDAFLNSLHANVVHYYLLAQGLLPALKAGQGSILNIGSKVAATGQGNTSGYAAANGARNALTREWAVELLATGIRVNAIIVAECFTPLYEKWINTLPDPQAVLQQITQRIPLGNRMTTAAEIGAMAAFLLSARSAHTTGQWIHVDGGYVHLDRAIGTL